ncbi:tyrosine-type recombinase/integrase [Escherichia coli]
MLPESLAPSLRELSRARAWAVRTRPRAAAALRFPTPLSGSIRAPGHSWPWLGFLRSTRIRPIDGAVLARRHHMYDQTFQRAFKRAVEQAGITKPATPHTLRHSFATALLRSGYGIEPCRICSAIPMSTTMIYTHVLKVGGAGARRPSMRCRPSLVRGRAAQVNPGGFTTPARRPSVPHRTAGCGKSSLRPLMAGSSPSLPDGSNPSAAIVQSASDVQRRPLLKNDNGGGSRRVWKYPDCLAWLRQAG